MSKAERRQRKYERACERAQQANEERLQKQQREIAAQMSDWVRAHRDAQNRIIPLTGSKKFEDQTTLLMARYLCEKQHSEVWLYEPPRTSETALRIDTMVPYIRNRKPYRNPYFDIFCMGSSLDDFEQCFRTSHGERPRLFMVGGRYRLLLWSFTMEHNKINQIHE